MLVFTTCRKITFAKKWEVEQKNKMTSMGRTFIKYPGVKEYLWNFFAMKIYSE